MCLDASVSYLAKVASYPELADLDQEQLMKEAEQVVTSRCTLLKLASRS